MLWEGRREGGREGEEGGRKREGRKEEGGRKREGRKEEGGRERESYDSQVMSCAMLEHLSTRDIVPYHTMTSK